MKDYKNIFEKYPELFPPADNRYEPISLFGFECDLGWYNIIEKACNVLYGKYKHAKTMVAYYESQLKNKEELISRSRKIDKEVANKTDEEIIQDREAIYNRLLEELEKEKEKLPKVVQVKEKFGTLRFYLDGAKDSDHNIASYAEAMSEVTCEVCGDQGTTYEMGWHKTLCRKHAIERYGEEKVLAYEN